MVAPHDVVGPPAESEVHVSESASEYYKPQEVALRMRVSIRTVYAWIKDGTIPGMRIGRTVRIPAAPFEALMERMKRTNPEPRKSQ